MQIKTFIDCIALKFYWIKEVYPKLRTVKLTDHWFQWFCCDVSFLFRDLCDITEKLFWVFADILHVAVKQKSNL